MKRRTFLKLTGSFALAAGLREGVSLAAAEQPDSRPNVLFIAVDDLRNWIGSLGTHPDVRTPHIDRLAARGMLFTRAYCSAPQCTPSRTSMLTGLQPSTSGLYKNDDPITDFRSLPVWQDRLTLPEYFRQQGYCVLGTGKLFHKADPLSWDEAFLEHPEGVVAGIDRWLPPDQPRMHGINALPHTFDWGALDVPEEELLDWRRTSWAADKLQQDFGQPFFLGIGLIRPHLPWYTPRAYYEQFPPDHITLPRVTPDDLDDVPAAAISPEDRNSLEWHRTIVERGRWPEAVAAYLAAISFADAQVGRLLDALDRSPHAANTVIVLWGDNGTHLGEKTYWSKDVLWEEALQVPLIVAAPGVTIAGSRCTHPVGLVNLYPTLNDLCGLPGRDDLDGTSLVPLLHDPQAAWDQPALSTCGYMNHSVRSAQWRYTRYHDGSEELYDHDADPLEWTNLAGDAQYNEVKAALAEHFPVLNVQPGG